jgi:acyl carrier protein/D-alanine--poly(phosphoribitol) ligase subunit 2
MDYAEKIKAFVCEEAGVSPEDISSETALFTDGFIDSFTMASLIGLIEEISGISVAPSDVTLENFDTITGMLRFIEVSQESA